MNWDDITKDYNEPPTEPAPPPSHPFPPVRMMLLDPLDSLGILLEGKAPQCLEGHLVVRRFANIGSAIKAIRSGEAVDVIMLDTTAQKTCPVEQFARLRVEVEGVSIIVVIGTDDEKVSTDLLSEGAFRTIQRDSVSPAEMANIVMRVAAYNSLAKSEEGLRNEVFDSLPDAVAIWEVSPNYRDCKLRDFNPAFERATAPHVPLRIGAKMREIFPQANQSAARDIVLAWKTKRKLTHVFNLTEQQGSKVIGVFRQQCIPMTRRKEMVIVVTERIE